MINRLKISPVLILCLFIAPLILLSNYNTKADSGPGITVSPDYPKEQIRNSNNINVKFNPNQHYNLTFKITNTSGEDKNITISPNTAYTSNSGNISFDNPNSPKDSSRKYDFRSLFNQKKRKIIVPANSTDKVSFGLKMPSKSYQGVILGGFYIFIPNNNSSNIKNNIEVNNQFSYGLAVVIHNNKEKAHPKLQLGNINASDNSQMQINSNIRNVDAGIISGMNVNSEIIKNSNNKVVSKSNRNNLSMAPNSSFNYGDVIENSLSPGSYKVKMNIADNSGDTWNESKNFRINTREYVTHFTKKVPWTLYILIGVIVLLALVIIFLVYYQLKNKNKKNDQLRNNTKD